MSIRCADLASQIPIHEIMPVFHVNDNDGDNDEDDDRTFSHEYYTILTVVTFQTDSSIMYVLFNYGVVVLLFSVTMSYRPHICRTTLNFSFFATLNKQITVIILPEQHCGT